VRGRDQNFKQPIWFVTVRSKVCKKQNKPLVATPWEGFLHEHKFYASIPFRARFELNYIPVVNQMGGGVDVTGKQ
jgi:hypothetical protein